MADSTTFPTDFEPYEATEDVYARIENEDRMILVAAKGQIVSPKGIAELGLGVVLHRVDEPSQHSTDEQRALAVKTTEAVAAGLLEPRNEQQRRGEVPVEAADANPADAPESANPVDYTLVSVSSEKAGPDDPGSTKAEVAPAGAAPAKKAAAAKKAAE